MTTLSLSLFINTILLLISSVLICFINISFFFSFSLSIFLIISFLLELLCDSRFSSLSSKSCISITPSYSSFSSFWDCPSLLASLLNFILSFSFKSFSLFILIFFATDFNGFSSLVLFLIIFFSSFIILFILLLLI